MEFFRIKKDIPFMSYGRYTTAISLVTFLFAVFFLSTKGLNFGVDFTGGTVIEVHYTQPADLHKVREQLAATGLPDALVQNFGSSHDVLIQVPLKQNLAGAKLSEQVMDGLRKQDAGVEKRRVEFVGPQVGKDLVENGALALLLVSLGIVGYLWLRFEWKFGLSAIIANLHDVVIILGFFAFFQWEFSLSVLAAVSAAPPGFVNIVIKQTALVRQPQGHHARRRKRTEKTRAAPKRRYSSNSCPRIRPGRFTWPRAAERRSETA